MEPKPFDLTQNAFSKTVHGLMSTFKLHVLLLCFLPATAFCGSLKIGGTGASLGPMTHMAQAYMEQFPNDSVVVLPSMGSGGGIKALIAGKIGLSLSGRPLKDKEIKLGLQQFVYAKSPFVIAVSKTNPIDTISESDFESILVGEKQQWPDKTPVRLIMRHKRESDTEFLRSISPSIEKAVEVALLRKGVLIAVTDQETGGLLEKLKGAIAPTTLTQIISENRNSKALTIGSLGPSVQNLQNGSYPFTKTFRLITPKEPSEIAKRFKNFIFSKKGHEILNQNGCLPQ